MSTLQSKSNNQPFTLYEDEEMEGSNYQNQTQPYNNGNAYKNGTTLKAFENQCHNQENNEIDKENMVQQCVDQRNTIPQNIIQDNQQLGKFGSYGDQMLSENIVLQSKSQTSQACECNCTNMEICNFTQNSKEVEDFHQNQSLSGSHFDNDPSDDQMSTYNDDDLSEHSDYESRSINVKDVPLAVNCIAPVRNESFPSVDTILANLLARESRRRPLRNYLDNQPDINQQMRSILVDWLVEVGVEFQLLNSTVHLAVDYIDRFLSICTVSRAALQLCGATALWIASKYNENHPPYVEDFVDITANTYTKQEFFKMEITMLNHLEFAVTSVIQLDFLIHFLQKSAANSQDVNMRAIKHFVEYLSELTLHDYNLIRFTPSQLVTACIIVALHTFNLPVWTSQMYQYLHYDEVSLALSVQDVYRMFFYQFHQVQLTALRDKYSTIEYDQVALIPPQQNPPVTELLRLLRETQKEN